jgi:hypothetical protein
VPGNRDDLLDVAIPEELYCLDVLIQTVPTTLAGVLALVETVAEPEYEHGDVSDAIIADYGDDGGVSVTYALPADDRDRPDLH